MGQLLSPLHVLKFMDIRQTPQNKRQEYVNAFNKGTQRNSCKFKLSVHTHTLT